MKIGDKQFHLLVDAVKDYAIFMLEPSGNIASWNTGAERIKGYRPDDVIGKHFSMFYTEVDRAAGLPEMSLQTALREGRYTAEGVRLRKDGSQFVADVLITPVYDDRKSLVGFAKVTRDVTARHKLEEMLRQRVDELAHADKRKDEFIAMLAHELRNPLAPILTGLNIVQRVASYPPVGERALQTMARQLKLMTRLVDDLLQISRMTNGKIELRREFAPLDAVIEQSIELVQPLIDSREQKLHVDCDRGMEIYCDPQRIVQVISNVVNNASKYTQQGGEVFLSAKEEGGKVRITVRDTGIGIRSEMLEKIFDVFTQDQRPIGTEMQSGLGIGLALARSVVAMHGGHIWAKSEGPGHGSCFEIVLPRQSVGDHEEVGDAGARQFRILVVDDNVDAATMVADLLEIEGYVVQKAFGGLDALQCAEKFHPHMILLDLLMPDITGYEVIKRVRKNPGGPVVVAVTGHGSESDREAARQAGFDEHIVKPVIGDAILDVVRRFLGRAAGGVPRLPSFTVEPLSSPRTA